MELFLAGERSIILGIKLGNLGRRSSQNRDRNRRKPERNRARQNRLAMKREAFDRISEEYRRRTKRNRNGGEISALSSEEDRETEKEAGDLAFSGIRTQKEYLRTG